MGQNEKKSTVGWSMWFGKRLLPLVGAGIGSKFQAKVGRGLQSLSREDIWLMSLARASKGLLSLARCGIGLL